MERVVVVLDGLELQSELHHVVAKLLLPIVQFDHCAEELGDLRFFEDLLILALILPTGTRIRRRGDVSLDALGTLRGGCYGFSLSFILSRESGHQPLPVPTAWGTDAHNVKTLWE